MWFAGGGTGGHLFPALAVAETLTTTCPAIDIGFVGSRRGIESRLVPQAGYPLRSLSLSGIKGRGAGARIGAAAQAAVAVARCVGWMLAARPGLVAGVGGYASGPAVLAAWLLRVPTMILEQNHYPGATNRALAPRVDRVCVPSEAARERLGGRGTITGNPVRREFTSIGPIPDRSPLSVVVFGGSRGARSINRAVVAALPTLAADPAPPRIVHQTGVDDEAEVRAAFVQHYPAGLWEVRAFVDDMADRLAAADLAVCRAGATTLSELAAAGRPALLVPYPHAADDHQTHNAQAVADAGGATVIADHDLEGEALGEAILELDRDRETLRRMAASAATLAVPDAADRIAAVALELLGLPEGGGDVL